MQKTNKVNNSNSNNNGNNAVATATATANTGNVSNADVNNCIGNLENHVHSVFASIRVSGEDFVYCAPSDLLSKIDDYCDELTMHEVRPPLMIRGKSGTGKTALLSNWLHRHEHHGNRMKGGNSDEFVFWHAVGCSRQSLLTNHLIRRLILALQSRFELNRPIPKSKERLSWELPRFLDLASKKGKIIIIIDGIHRLRSTDGTEDSLSWLPLELPPNVRIVVSVTDQEHIHPQHGEEPSSIQSVSSASSTAPHTSMVKKNKIILELMRRNIPELHVNLMDRNSCRSLILEYIHNSINSEAAAITMGPYADATLHQNRSGAHVHMPSKGVVPGFLLFDAQITTLLNHPCGGNPLFLRLFLRCLHFLSNRGYSLWALFDDWISSRNISDLYDKILSCSEWGYRKTRELSQIANDMTIAAGGISALKTLFPQHPSFRDHNNNNSHDGDTDNVGNNSNAGGGGELYRASSSSSPHKLRHAQTSRVGSRGEFGTLDSLSGEPEDSNNGEGLHKQALSSLVRNNLGDQEWVALERQAQKTLQRAVLDVQHGVQDILRVQKNKYELVNAIVTKINAAEGDLIEGEDESVSKAPTRTRALSADTTSVSSSHHRSRQDVLEHSFDEDSLRDSSDEEDEEAAAEDADLHGNSRSHVASRGGNPVDAHNNSGGNTPYGHVQSRPDTTSSSKKQQAAAVAAVDPSEGFFSLPIYIRGGAHAPGFGDLLANALSLLYVARQGLKEEELWKMLSYLQMKAKRENKVSVEKRTLLENRRKIVRKFAHAILEKRADLDGILRADDTTKTGYISMDVMYSSLKKSIPDLFKEEFAHLLEYVINGHHTLAAASSTVASKALVVDDQFIEYEVFFTSLSKLYRKMKTHDFKRDVDLEHATTTILVHNNLEDDFESFTLTTNHHAADNNHNNHNTKGPGQAEGDNHEDTTTATAQDSFESLGPVVEELLLELLCALGVLYSPENKVLVLPSESEVLRSTILNKYVLQKGGKTLPFWHNMMIQYFRIQANTLRKCEELPWHLKICRKWTSLKDTLVDLQTFDLMFNNNLKDELIEYWTLLTEGPLYVAPPTTSSSSSTQPPMRQSPFQHAGNNSLMSTNNGDPQQQQQLEGLEPAAAAMPPMSVLQQIDVAIAQRLSLKDIRKSLLKAQLQPFDVVEELNRSVEIWVSQDHPTPKELHRTISQIANFLLEFAKASILYPQCRRMGIDMTIFQQFNVDLMELKAAMTMANHASMDADPLNSNNSNNNNASSSQDGLLLLSSPSKAAAQDVEKDNYFDGLKHEIIKFPTTAMVASNFYLYLRWIWIQFPWLALNQAAGQDALKSSPHDVHNEYEHPDEDHHSSSDQSMESIKHLLRVWHVKKTDPTLAVFHNSLNRRLAAIKPRTSLSSSLERNVDVSCKKLYDEIMKPSHIASVRLGLHGQRDKFRRTFEEEIESTKNIPFSYHGAKIMKHKTMFPSYTAQLKETNQKKLDSDLLMNEDGGNDLDSTSQRSIKSLQKKIKPLGKFDVEAALKASGNPATAVTKESTFFLTELDDEIRRMNSEDYLQSHRNEMGTLIKDEVDLENDTVMDRIARMKSICNKLIIIQREKERAILELEKTILLRQESDTIMMNEVQSGETLIKSLHDRNVVMEKSLEEAKKLEDGYLSLIRSLKRNPPYVESHVKSLEVEVSLAEKQFEELCQHRSKLYFEGERIEKLKKQQLLDRIQYFKTARQEIAIKKKQVQKELKSLKESVGNIAGGKHHRGHHRLNALRTQKDLDKSSSKRRSPNNSDSDDSDMDPKSPRDMSLTQPVMHFLNALVRKITYNETVVKETDTTLNDVKKRASVVVKTEDEILAEQQHQQKGGKKKKGGKRGANGRTVKTTTGEEHHVGGASRSPVHFTSNTNSNSNAANNGNNNNNTNNNGGNGQYRRLSSDQLVSIRNSLKSMPELAGIASENSSVTTNNASTANREQLKTQLQLAMQILFEKTESNSLDEFIDRYLQGQQLLESLRSQQVLVDSRLSQLRSEHTELSTIWGDISYLAHEKSELEKSASAASSATNNTENEGDFDQQDRYLDNQLFSKEVRLHHFQRLYDNGIHTISEVRTAVGHIMNFLVVNTKLLSGLPKSPHPNLQSDQDIAAALSWCEDRIIALNEALTMDANRTNTNSNEENKPIAQRQTELAILIQDMIQDKKKRPNGNYKNAKKQQGSISKVLINTSDKSTFISSPRIVMVPPAGKVDKLYDSKVGKLTTERDRQAELYEGQTYYNRDTKNNANNDMQRFLADGLDKAYTKNMSRQAKILMFNRPGRTATYGTVLEELMLSRGQNMEFLNLADSSNSPNKNKVEAKMIHAASAKIKSLGFINDTGSSIAGSTSSVAASL